MDHGHLIVACDLGTTAFRVLVTAAGPDGLKVLGAGRADAAGFRDGDFVDLASGGRALQQAVEQAEAAADVDITGFYYSVSGSHLHPMTARCQLQLGGQRRAVTQDDVADVMARAHGISIPFDHAILVANPVGFAVDGIEGIVDPVGRLGSHLEVDAHLITGSSTVLQNVEEVFGRIKREPVGWCVDVLASSTVLLDPEEKEMGVLLVDVGGAATQWAAFRHGRIAGFGSVPLGGRHLTDDLSHGLRVSPAQAETIKRDRGLVLRSLAEEVDPEVLFEEAQPEESPGLIATILEPRLEEVLALVKKAVGPALAAELRAGVVLTGGGVRCEGTALLAEEVFQRPVEVRLLPADVPGAGRLSDDHWATALGLAAWAAGESVGLDPAAPPPPRKGLKGVLKRLWPGK